MEKYDGYYVFTPLSGEQRVKIHKANCGRAHIKPDHPDRKNSWRWFTTYKEALQYAMSTRRNFNNGLDCKICNPRKQVYISYVYFTFHLFVQQDNTNIYVFSFSIQCSRLLALDE